jgi:hypothetical protein
MSFKSNLIQHFPISADFTKYMFKQTKQCCIQKCRMILDWFERPKKQSRSRLSPFQ